jgi:hypothetical protein
MEIKEDDIMFFKLFQKDNAKHLSIRGKVHYMYVGPVPASDGTFLELKFL